MHICMCSWNIIHRELESRFDSDRDQGACVFCVSVGVRQMFEEGTSIIPSGGGQDGREHICVRSSPSESDG